MDELAKCIKSGEIVLHQNLIERLKDYQSYSEDNGLDRDIRCLSDAVFFLCRLFNELDEEQVLEAHHTVSQISLVVDNLKDLSRYNLKSF
jgi:hypothetical protein